MTRSAPLLVGIALIGCAGPVPPDPAAETTRGRVQTLLGHVLRYAAEHDQQAPPDEAALRKFLAGKGVTDIDVLLTSPRDGRPFVLTFGKSLAADTSKGNVPPELREKVVVVTEQTGANGKRVVGYSSGLVAEIETAVPSN